MEIYIKSILELVLLGVIFFSTWLAFVKYGEALVSDPIFRSIVGASIGVTAAILYMLLVGSNGYAKIEEAKAKKIEEKK